MSQPTKQQWDEFKEQLSGRYGRQYLQCDDYAVSINIEMCKKRSLHYAVYINGEMRGEWVQVVAEDKIDSLPEISRRFCMHNKRGSSTKTIKLEERVLGKRECKKRGVYKKRILTMPYWKSINSLIAHFKRHNPSICIIAQNKHEAIINDLTTTTD